MQMQLQMQMRGSERESHGDRSHGTRPEDSAAGGQQSRGGPGALLSVAAEGAPTDSVGASNAGAGTQRRAHATRIPAAAMLSGAAAGLVVAALIGSKTKLAFSWRRGGLANRMALRGSS